MEAPKLELHRYRKTIKQGDELVSIVSLWLEQVAIIRAF
jgi:hypothetical protein